MCNNRFWSAPTGSDRTSLRSVRVRKLARRRIQKHVRSALSVLFPVVQRGVAGFISQRAEWNDYWCGTRHRPKRPNMCCLVVRLR